MGQTFGATRADRPHRRYLELVEQIEKRFEVAIWRSDDIDLWPLASQDLFLDIFCQAGGNTAPKPPPFLARALSGLALPATNLWESRSDFEHFVGRPHRADTILLGDGVSLDLVDGRWHDRFCGPIAEAIEKRGRTCFSMHSGNLRLPWSRPTFAANQLAARAAFRAALAPLPPISLPDHFEVLRLLEQAGVDSPSLASQRLARRAQTIAAQAAEFCRILRRVQPTTAYVVSYYAGLGHAFALACRRQGILCIDLQHCPHGAIRRGYQWSKIPPRGYSTLPALFWTWSEAEAADIRSWSDTLDQPWHQVIVGGHTQIAAMAASESDRLWQSAVAATGDTRKYEREILVTLQPTGGKRHIWEALSEEIHSSPDTWRWWIRRHPASTNQQDQEYSKLVGNGRAAVIAGKACQVPLPALLAHMDAQVSLASGAACEAVMLGVPAYFIDQEARDTFPQLLSRGEAELVDVRALSAAIERARPRIGANGADVRDLERTLEVIDRRAFDYSRLCAETAYDKIDCGVRIVGQSQMPSAC
jgi:hypothetical protein